MSGFDDLLPRGWTRLLGRLAGHRAFRAGAAYIFVAWILLQVIDVVFPILGFSDESARGILLLLVVGFFITLGLASVWEARIGGSNTEPFYRALWWGFLTAAVVAGGFVYLTFTEGPREAPGASSTEGEAPPRSIAVLPFADLSPEGDQEYFATGLAEEILDALTRIPGLRVVARTSSFALADDSLDVREIGDRLKARAVLEGSVRKAGDQVRVTAQLIDAESGYHLVSRQFEGRVGHIFAFQRDLARSIVDSLGIHIRARGAVATDSLAPDAFEAYLRARHAMREGSEEGLRRSVELFQQVREMAPGFAPALAGEAMSRVLLVGRGAASPETELPGAAAAAEEALAVDPRLPDARAVLGYAGAWRGEVAEAEEHFRIALRINEGHVPSLVWLAELLEREGRGEEAEALRERVREADPVGEARGVPGIVEQERTPLPQE